MTDEINASVQHTNDPVVRSSLGKAGMVIANALSSPRRVSMTAVYVTLGETAPKADRHPCRCCIGEVLLSLLLLLLSLGVIFGWLSSPRTSIFSENVGFLRFSSEGQPACA